MTASLKKTTKSFISFSVLFLLLWSCNSKSQKADMSKNIDAVKKYHQVWSNGNIEELDKIIAPNFTSHFIGGFEYQGIDGAKNSVLETKKAFPDWKEDIVDIIVQDDKVVTRYHSTGTQLGNWDGIDSTGNKVDIYEASIYRLKDGKIVEQWGFWDEINLKKQMTAKSNGSK
jgi:predicted ester cyclase